MSWKDCCFDWEAGDAEQNESYSLVIGIFLNISMCCENKKNQRFFTEFELSGKTTG